MFHFRNARRLTLSLFVEHRTFKLGIVDSATVLDKYVKFVVLARRRWQLGPVVLFRPVDRIDQFSIEQDLNNNVIYQVSFLVPVD